MPEPMPVPANRALLEQIARASADLVNIVYEFADEDRDTLQSCMLQPLDHLDDLLVQAGLRPQPPPPPTEEEIAAWVGTRVRANEGEVSPKLGSGARWHIVEGRSLKERVLYRCTLCGRLSHTPDKICGVSGCGHDEHPELARKWREGIPKRDQFFSGPVREG